MSDDMKNTTALTSGTVSGAQDNATNAVPNAAAKRARVARAPTPEEQKEAAKDRPVTGYDNYVASFPTEAVFAQAAKDEDTATRATTTATQRVAAVCLAQWHLSVMAGDDGHTHDNFWTLNKTSGEANFRPKMRREFIGKMLTRFGIMPASKVDANGKPIALDVQASATAFYRAREALIGRGLDYAIDLCCAGGTGNVRLTPGYVLNWFDTKAGVFFVSPATVLKDEQIAMGHLATLLGGGVNADALIRKHPRTFRIVENEPLIALDGSWFTANIIGHGVEDFQATNARVRAVADSKRWHTEKVTTVDPATGKKTTKTVKTAIEPAQQRQQSTAAAAAASAKSNAGRPAGSTPEAGPQASEMDFRKALHTATMAIAAIMKLPADRKNNGKPEEYFWSNDPNKDLITATIDMLTRYRADAIAFEMSVKTARQEAANANKVKPNTKTA